MREAGTRWIIGEAQGPRGSQSDSIATVPCKFFISAPVGRDARYGNLAELNSWQAWHAVCSENDGGLR
jgi:hypothetical protein